MHMGKRTFHNALWYRMCWRKAAFRPNQAISAGSRGSVTTWPICVTRLTSLYSLMAWVVQRSGRRLTSLTTAARCRVVFLQKLILFQLLLGFFFPGIPCSPQCRRLNAPPPFKWIRGLVFAPQHPIWAECSLNSAVVDELKWCFLFLQLSLGYFYNTIKHCLKHVKCFCFLFDSHS